MKKENKRRKEIIDSAIIKLEKKHLLERIEEKAQKQELTKDERIILIEDIYNNYCNKRIKLMKKNRLNSNMILEIDRVSYHILNAIDNALDKNNKESILVLIKQNKLFNDYYDLVMSKSKINVREDLEFKIEKNDILIKNK